MSYIRCTSNPEGMYIYGTTDGYGRDHISISAVDERYSRNMGRPVTYPENNLCPTPKEFYEVCEAYAKAWGDLDEPISCGEFSIREVHVSAANEDILTDETLKEWGKLRDVADRASDWATSSKYRTHTKVGLFWRNRSVVLWETTWWYIVDGVVADLKRDRRDKAKRRRKREEAKRKRR